MNQERDRFLTEQLGECWHEWASNTIEPYHDGSSKYYCKCGLYIIYSEQDSYTKDVNKHFKIANDFSAWEGFGKLWEFCQKQGWWDEFATASTALGYDTIARYLINPDRFADAVYEFLKEKQS